MKLREIVSYKFTVLFLIFLFAGIFLDEKMVMFVAGVLFVMMFKELRK